jgi:KUP system potassium uptake protein
VQLGYAPRILIRHTSERQIGQIYIPSINFLLMLCTIGLVLAFQKSSNLAAAYGVAVTATMAITTLLLAVVERQRWRWTWIAIAALTVPLLSIDLSFFAANLVKVVDGGWFPLVVGIIIFTLMATWHRGRQLLRDRATESVLSIDGFLDNLARNIIPRVPGTAVFLTRMPEGIPSTLLHNIKHNKIAHVRIVLLTIESEETPRLSDEERWTMKELGHGVYRLVLRFGFMEDPDIPAILHGVNEKWRLFDPMSTSYFLGRELLIATRRPGMAIWRERLFSSMMRNSTSASTFFHLPPNQVIELGEQIEI